MTWMTRKRNMEEWRWWREREAWCSMIHAPRIKTSDGGLRSLNSPRLTVDEEGTLWFSYVTPEDASEDALYACAASSATRTEYRMGNWVYLNVSYPGDDKSTLPESNLPPVKQYVSDHEVTALQGDEVKLYCIFGG
nr:neuroglian-like isoform X3 [Cherax quadricarinatus]